MVQAALLPQLEPPEDAFTVAIELVTNSYRQPIELPERGRLTIDWYAKQWTRQGHARVPQRVLLATGARLLRASRGGWMSLKATAAGRRLVQHESAITITATARFRPTSTDPISASKTFRLS
jgi:hypothetical protein